MKKWCDCRPRMDDPGRSICCTRSCCWPKPAPVMNFPPRAIIREVIRATGRLLPAPVEVA